MHGARMRPSARVQPLRCTGRHVLPACVLGGRRRTVASVRASYYPGQGPDPMQSGRRYRRGRDLQQQLADMLMGGPVDDPDRFLQLLSSSPRLLDRRMLPPQQAGPSLEDLYRLQQQRQQQQAAEAEAARRRAAEEAEAEERRREALRAAMLQNARRHLPRYDSPSLARLASALASAGVEDPALCNDIMAELQRRAQAQQAAPEPRSLAELFDALATMHHRPSDEQVESLLRAQQQQREREREEKERQQRALLEQQRAEAEQRRRMLMQQQQQRRPEEEEQQRRRLAPQQQVVSVPGAGPMTPDDAARLLQSLSRLGYRPDDRTLSQLLEVLQPQRLQLQPTPQQQVAARDVAKEDTEAEEEEDEEGYEDDEAEQAVMDEADAEAAVRLSLERDAQAVANAVRALERMGRQDRAAQLRQRFQQHVMGVQARLARERRAAAQQRARAEAEARVRAQAEAEARARAEAEARAKMEAQARAKAEAEAKAKAEAEAKAKAEAAAKAAAAARQEEQRRQVQRQQQQEDAEAAEGPIAPYVVQLRAQLTKALRTAAGWQQIRGLLFNYQEALDLPCLVAAAARLVELLSARTTGMVLRERAELGDLLQGWGELTRRRLGRASASQTCSLLVCVCRLRYLDEQLLVALLRRLRDTLPAARGDELAAVLRALAACGVRPSPPWMDSFLGRLEETLVEVSTLDLIELSVCLMQLEAHPDRSWLGAYLDELQAREGELTQLQVADAVRAVAAMDRPFLAAWRQAAAFKQQMGQQGRRQERQASASAVESVDDVLGEQEGGLPEGLQAALPPMHPKQQSMAQQQQPQTQQQQQPSQPQTHSKAAASPAAGPGAQAQSAEQQQQQLAGSGRFRPPPLQSVELDVDSEQAAAASVEDASSNGRQLPGSRSVEGLYYGHEDEYDEGELYDEGEGPDMYGAAGPRLVLDEQVAEAEADGARGVGTSATVAGGTTAAAGARAASAQQQQGPAKSSGASLGGKGMVVELKPAMGQPELQGAQAARGGAAKGQQGSPTGQPPLAAEERKAQQGQQTSPPPQQKQQEHKAQGTTGEASKPQSQAQTADEKHTDKGQGKGAKDVHMGKKEQHKSEKQLKEEAAQVRALRSLLLERYEAVQAYKEELEARQRRAQAEEARREEDGAVRQFSDAEVAAAARLMGAREQLQRLQADYDNFKRRAEAEREVATARARSDALKPLLGLADNFDRAAQTIKPKTEGEKGIHESYQAIKKELQQFFKDQGLSEVGQEGDMFDPNVHEAVMREERDDLEDGTITAVFQKGYRLGDLLVRPALVRVAYS